MFIKLETAKKKKKGWKQPNSDLDRLKLNKWIRMNFGQKY